jgi:hypothetical protein
MGGFIVTMDNAEKTSHTLTLSPLEEQYIKLFKPNSDYTKNFRYNIFPQPNGLAFKISEKVVYRKNGKDFHRWANHKSIHVKTNTLKNRDTSVNIFVRTKSVRKVKIINRSNDLFPQTLDLIPGIFLVKHILDSTKHSNQHYEECMQTLGIIEQEMKMMVENPRKFPSSEYVLYSHLNAIVIAITYPILFHLKDPTNIILGRFNGSPKMLPPLRARNMSDFFSRIRVPKNFTLTRNIMLNNLDKINEATISVIQIIINSVKEDSTSAEMVESFFTTYNPETQVIHKNNYSFIVAGEYGITASQLQHKLEFMTRLTRNLPAGHVKNIVLNKDFHKYIFSNNLTFIQNSGGKKFTGVEPNIEIGCLINYGLYNHDHKKCTVEKTDRIIPYCFIESIFEEKTKWKNNIATLQEKLIDGAHIMINDMTVSSASDFNRGIFPNINRPTIQREFEHQNNEISLLTLHSNMRRGEIKNNPIFSFISKKETHIFKGNNSSAKTYALMFNDVTYQKMLENMLAFTNNLCKKYKIEPTPKTRSYIMKGYLLTGPQRIKNFHHFMRNLKAGLTFNSNLYALSKKMTFKKTLKLSGIPEDWIQNMYPEIKIIQPVSQTKTSTSYVF